MLYSFYLLTVTNIPPLISSSLHFNLVILLSVLSSHNSPIPRGRVSDQWTKSQRFDSTLLGEHRILFPSGLCLQLKIIFLMIEILPTLKLIINYSFYTQLIVIQPKLSQVSLLYARGRASNQWTEGQRFNSILLGEYSSCKSPIPHGVHPWLCSKRPSTQM